jgi:threonine dehydrogenase-like Zn-dependent dehydrogenase
VIDLLARERIDPRGMVTSHVGFGEFCAAFEALKRPSDQIKVVLEPT